VLDGLFGDDPVAGGEPGERFSPQVHDDLYEASNFAVAIELPAHLQREKFEEEAEVLRTRGGRRGAVEAVGGGATNLRRGRTSETGWSAVEGGYEVGVSEVGEG